jgi:hypothetical protein
MRVTSPVPHKRARIEIIPLIDIMFFVLASFMMVSLSQTPHEGYSGQSAGCSCTSAKHEIRTVVESHAYRATT